MKVRPKVSLAAALGLLLAGVSLAQDVQKYVPYVCNGERIVVESCNIRDTSDTSTCSVGHPDTILPNGLMKYTTETRGTLKKLLPTCKQPTADQIAHAQAFEKKQNDLYEANTKKSQAENDAIEARAQTVITGKKPQTPEERALNRCVTAGRLPASCTGNSLLGAFSQMVGQVLPDAAKEPAPGPVMAGVFVGPGSWRLDFIDDGVLVNCSVLSPDQRKYALEFKSDGTFLVIDTTPKPLTLAFRPDGSIVGPGPVVIDGVIATGYQSGGSSHGQIYKDGAGNNYDSSGNRSYGDVNNLPGHATFSQKRVTCPALNLSTKGASVGIQTMQTDLLKTAFGGEKGPPTPPGIRMRGIFAAPTGFSVQFFPESAILGCGPDAARAYPYTVVAEGAKAVIQIAASDHPLALTFNKDGSLDPGAAAAYQVHGRTITGQNDNGDFTFSPMEQTCNLGLLVASKTIPASGGAASAVTASAGNRAVGGANAGATLSMPNAPLGDAVLTIVSGFSPPPNAANPLAGYPYVLARDSFSATLGKVGVAIPPGTQPLKVYGMACQSRSPDCQKIAEAWKAEAISAARGDVSGKAVLPGVPPGTYYLMISVRVNNQPLLWDVKVDLKDGANSLTVDPKNAGALK